MNTLFSPGLFGRLFTNTPSWAFTISQDSAALVHAGRRTVLTLEQVAQGKVTNGHLWADLTIAGHQLSGLTNERARVLIKSAKGLQEAATLLAQAKQRHAEEEKRRKEHEARLQAEFIRLSEPLPRVLEALDELHKSSSYIREHHIRNFRIWWQSEYALLANLETLLGDPFFRSDMYTQTRQRLSALTYYTEPPYAGVKARNKHFVAAEKKKEQWIDFFKNVEKSPLTEEQQEAVIVHEDRNRLIAAAGSGKSSTLVAKVGYALKKGYVTQDEVIALAFNGDAARELSERLKQRLGLSIKAQTFHSLGKAIIREAQDKRSVLKETGIALKNQLESLLQQDADYRSRFFLHHAIYQRPEPEREFSSVAEYEAYIRQVGKRDKSKKNTWGIPSLRGEYVRSFEELAIANWLYVQGVNYRYEELYPHDVSELGWSKYEPDFCFHLPDGTTLYHEHFALRADKSSPFGAAYVRGVKQKRELHGKHGTPLIETTSNDFRLGGVLVELEAKLKAHGVAFAPLSASQIEAVLKVKPHGDFVRLIGTVIAHAKESGYDEETLRARARTLHDQVRAQSFLTLLFPLRQRYDAYLEGNAQIDFADMIGKAAQHVREGAYRSPYKFILVDEFQDISRGRTKLVQALLAQHLDSVLFGVGDDWQAINRFAGSDLSIMRNFEAEFGRTETNYLRKTFRSNQGISNVAARFVSANPEQLEKEVEAIRSETDGVVRLVEFTDYDDQREKIIAKLAALAEQATAENRLITVMLLGRYKYKTTEAIPPEFVTEWNTTYAGRLLIKQKEKEEDGKKKLLPLDSAHSSKGLEADVVLVHSLQARVYGFPNSMEDDPLLSLVLPEREAFPDAEERRLFYVALTRAKEEVTLYVHKDKPSPFVIELLGKEYGDTVTFEAQAERPEPCPKCKHGYLKLKPGKRGPFIGCSAFSTNHCDESRTVVREGVR